MIILGNGFVANSLHKYKLRHKNVLIFACGVANSHETALTQYIREEQLLTTILKRCQQENLKLVYFSSAGEVYKPGLRPSQETDTPWPRSLYGFKKIKFEQLIQKSGAPYLICRLPNLVGQNQNPCQLFPSLINQIKTGQINVFTRAKRDLLGVEDFSRALMDLLRLGCANKIINIVSGISTPITQIVSYMKRQIRIPCLINNIDQGEKHCFSNKKLKQLLDWPKAYFTPDYYQKVINKYLKFYL